MIRKKVRIKIKVKQPPQSSTAKTPQPVQSKKQKNPSKTVLVLGAGMAGITAAQALQLAGLSVIVIEGRDRIGGRIWTDDSLGFPIDLGASWVHGLEGNPITKLAAQNRNTLWVTPKNDFLLFDEQGMTVDPETLTQLEQDAAAMMQSLQMQGLTMVEDVSMAEAIALRLSQQPLSRFWQKLMNWRLARWEILFGAALSDHSLKFSQESDGFPGEDALIKEGYGSLLRQLAKRLDIRLNQRVHTIEYNEQGVAVHTESETFHGDYVIVTFPLGVLKQGDIRFEPDLPQSKKEAIARLGMGVINKVVLVFSDIFWSESSHFIGYVSEMGSDFPFFLNLYPVWQQPALVGFVGADHAVKMESMSDEVILDRVLDTMRRIAQSARLPKLLGYHITRWSSDPFARGAYAYIPVGASEELMDTIAKPVKDRLFFAGEATIANYCTTVHGAYLSGIREANRILALP